MRRRRRWRLLDQGSRLIRKRSRDVLWLVLCWRILSFDKTLLLTMLEIGGFTAIDGGTDLSPEQVAGKVTQFKPDILAVPLIKEVAGRKFVEANKHIQDTGGELPIIAYGRGARGLSGQKFTLVEADSFSAFSKIAEILISKA